MFKQNSRSAFILSFILVAVSFLIFHNTYLNEYVLDDFIFINADNFIPFEHWSSFFTKSYDQHYHPIYYIINTNLFRAFKEAPWILHAVNISLHGINALILFLFLLLLTKNQILSFVAGFFWMIHPINALTVNCLIANSLMVYSAALLLSLYSIALYCERNQKRYFALSLILFVISILNFEGPVLMPFYLFALLFIHYKKSLKQTFQIILPFGALILIYLFLWFSIADVNARLFEKMQYPSINIFSTILVYFHAIGWYIKNLFLPDNLTYIQTILLPTNKFYVGLGLAFFASSFFLLRKKSLSSFAYIWFISGCLLVIPGIFAHYRSTGYVMEPHWLYFNSMGIVFFVVLFFHERKIFPSKSSLICVCVTLSCFLIFYTQTYNWICYKEKNYYEYWLKLSPGNTIARHHLAEYYIRELNVAVDPALKEEMMKAVQKYHIKGFVEKEIILLEKLRWEE